MALFAARRMLWHSAERLAHILRNRRTWRCIAKPTCPIRQHSEIKHCPPGPLPIITGLIAIPALLIPLTASGNSRWGGDLLEQLRRQPRFQMQENQLLAEQSAAEALAQPLYNPELSAGYEEEGRERNYRLGLSQTLDLTGKRQARTQQARAQAEIAAAQNKLRRETYFQQALQALIELAAASELAVLAEDQRNNLDRLIALLHKRRTAGDIGAAEAELAALSLAQSLEATAFAQTQLAAAEASVRNWVGEDYLRFASLDRADWSDRGDTRLSERLQQSPQLLVARHHWQSQLAGVDVARSETRADPTVGLYAGRTGEEDTLGLELSMPLFIANGYRAELQQANHQAIAAEQAMQARFQQVRARLRADLAQLDSLTNAYQRWQELTQNTSASSLHRLWESGELNLSDYLSALNSRNQSLAAGVRLQAQKRTALMQWLLDSGQLQSWLSRQ